MDYLKEAENGERICIEELRVLDIAEFIKDLQADPDNYPIALARIFYAGYSIGYRDGQAETEADHKADADGSADLEVQ